MRIGPGARWPNIVFFSLYPLLLRVNGPLVGGNFDVAAMLVAQAALLAALLLAYLTMMFVNGFGLA